MDIYQISTDNYVYTIGFAALSERLIKTMEISNVQDTIIIKDRIYTGKNYSSSAQAIGATILQYAGKVLGVLTIILGFFAGKKLIKILGKDKKEYNDEYSEEVKEENSNENNDK